MFTQPITTLPRRARTILGVCGVIVIATLIFVLRFYMPREKSEAISRWRAQLTLTANDRGSNLERTINGIFADIQTIADYPTARFLASNELPPHAIPDPRQAEPHLRDLLAKTIRPHGLNNAWIVKANGTVVTTAFPESEVPVVVRELAQRITLTGKRSAQQLDTDDRARTYFGAPIRSERTGEVVGAAVVDVSSKDALFSIITGSWDPTRTGEVLLVQRTGDSVEVITRLKKKAREHIRFAASNMRLPGAAALAGKAGFGEYLDYAGDRVFAVARVVKNMPWAVVTKIDEDEALAPARREAWGVGLTILALLIAMAGAGYAVLIEFRSQRLLLAARENERQARADQDLRRSYQMLRSITEASGDVIFVKDLDERFVFINSAGARILALHPEHILGRTTAEIESPNKQLFEEFDAVLRVRSCERVIEDTATGQCLLTTMSPLLDQSGEGIGRVVVARDITEIKEAQQQFEELNARAHALLEANVVGVVICMADGRVLEANDYYLKLLGYSRAELEEGLIRWTDSTPAEHFASDQVALAELEKRGMSTPYEKEYIRRDSSRVWALVGDTLLPGPGQRILTFVIDISGQKSLEAQYQQAQKMEAVGRLAGGVAHDFNNILTAIKGIASLAIEDCHSSDPLYKDLRDIDAFADRATALTKQLLAFSRRQVLQPTVFDMRNLLDGLQRMLRRLIGEDIELTITMCDAPLMIHADPGQMEQVLLNLAVNARDAMPTGGTLRIELDSVGITDVPRTMRNGHTAHRMVRLLVTDTGCGMTEEVRTRIFEPFFTTKEVNKGTGLGLASVYGIVKQSHGSIDVQSAPGKGTTFTILFPSVIALQTKAVRTEVPQSLQSGRVTILLVEDDDAVRALASRSILKKGHVVYEARNANEAMSLADRHFSELDIVVTDLVMPGISGREMMRQMRDKFGPVKAVFMSGYTADVMDDMGQLDGVFLEKPFTPPQLLKVIESTVVSAGTPS